MNALGITLELLGTVLGIAGWFGATRVRAWQDQLHRLMQVRQRVKDIVAWLARSRKILFRLLVPFVFLTILAPTVALITFIVSIITHSGRELFSVSLLSFACWFPVVVVAIGVGLLFQRFQELWRFSQGYYDDEAQRAAALTNWILILACAEAIFIYISVGLFFSAESWLQEIGKGSVVIFLCLWLPFLVSLGYLSLLHASEVIATKVAWLLGLLVLPVALLGYAGTWIVLSPFLVAEPISVRLPDHPSVFKVLSFLFVFVGGGLQLLEALLSKGH